MVVLGVEVYKEICEFVRNFRGHSIDCEIALKRTFPTINSDTVDSILAKEWQLLIKLNYPRICGSARQFLQE